MNEPIKLAVIYGSARPGRFCETVVRWLLSELESRRQFRVDVIDPANPAAQSLEQQLENADAFIVVTPEYNHGYPAALKALIDSAYDEWQAKPVGFVSYGGASGGIRAVEQLRQVFAELHAVTVRDAVSFANAGERFDESGRPRMPDRPRRALATMLARLRWWAQALRTAREADPYGLAVV